MTLICDPGVYGKIRYYSLKGLVRKRYEMTLTTGTDATEATHFHIILVTLLR